MNMNLNNNDSGEDYKVYDITYHKTGYPHFLVYKVNQWVRMSAKHFRPYSEQDLLKALNDWSKTGVLTTF